MPDDLQDLVANWPLWLAVTLCLGGPAAYASGRALARHWRSFATGVPAMAAIAGAADFLLYALFGTSAIPAWSIAAALSQGDVRTACELLSGWAATFAILLVIGFGSWRFTRARQMRRQYPFLVGG